MELNKHLLAEHLNRLEHQAATVASLIDFDDEDLLQEIAEAFAPLPDGKPSTPVVRQRWRRQWCDWLKDCGDRWESRPPEHPAGEDVADLLLAWCRRSTRKRRRRT